MTNSNDPNEDPPATDTVDGEVPSTAPSPVDEPPRRAAEELERAVPHSPTEDYGPEGPKAHAEPVDDRRIDGVYVDHFKRLGWVLRHKLKLVVAANMFFEDETGIINEAGQSNLTEALSHIGTIFEGAERMSYSDQAHEIHEMEDHLRRSMMESYELVYRKHMGDVDKAWEHYDELVRPLLDDDKVHGLPPVDKLEGLRRKCKRLVLDGRNCKRAHTWVEWEKGTNSLVAACKAQAELLNELNAAIRIAEQHRKDEAANQRDAEAREEGRELAKKETDRGIHFSKKMMVVSTIIAVLLLFAGWGLNELTDDAPPAPPVQEQQQNDGGSGQQGRQQENRPDRGKGQRPNDTK
jgi:hypothetical protein